MQKSDDFARYLLFLGRVLSKARLELEAGGPPTPEPPESESEDGDFARVFGDFLLQEGKLGDEGSVHGRSGPPDPRANIENGSLGR
jgi:hypothetical protein